MHALKTFALSALAFAALAVPALASPAEDAAQAKYLVAAAPDGSEAAVLDAEKAYKELLAAAPGHLGYRARLASLEAMKARHVWMPWSKGKHSSEAVKQFDALWRDVSASGDAVATYEFHFFRGQTYVHFPRFLDKHDLALDDLKQACESGASLGRPKAEFGLACDAVAHDKAE